MNKALKPTFTKILLVIPFSVVMSLVAIAAGPGFMEGWLLKWLHSLLVMIPVGYLCASIFVPMSQAIISKIDWK